MVSRLRTAGAMTWRSHASGMGLNDSCHLKDIHIDKRKHDFSVLANLSLSLLLLSFTAPAPHSPQLQPQARDVGVSQEDGRAVNQSFTV